MSEQPRSVMPQELASSLGQRRRRNTRPLPVAAAAPAPGSESGSRSGETEPTTAESTSALAAAKTPAERLHAVPASGIAEGPLGEAQDQTGVQPGARPGNVAPEASTAPQTAPAPAPVTAPITAPVTAAAPETSQAPRRTRSSSAGASRSRTAASGRRAEPAPAKIGRPKSASAASSSTEDHLPAATAVYVPLEVRDLVAARRRQLDPAPTTAEVVLRAIEAQYARLPQLVEEALRPETGSLFTFSTPARTNEVKVQMGLRLTRGQLRILDQVEEQVGASSRGQLVALAVRAELGSS